MTGITTQRSNSGQLPIVVVPQILSTVMSTRGDRLRQARAKHYRSARAAAEALDVPISTYNGHERAGHPGGRDYDPEQASFYARAFGVSDTWLLTGRGKEPAGTSPAVVETRVAGEVEAGTWREALFNFDVDSDPENDKYPPIPYVSHPRYRGVPQFAVKVIGTSVNKIIPDGYFAVCVPYWEVRGQVTEGDLVVIQRKQGELFEGTIKRIARGSKNWELHPESDDPKHLPIVLPEQRGEDDASEVEIVGLVIWQGAPI